MQDIKSDWKTSNCTIIFILSFTAAAVFASLLRICPCTALLVYHRISWQSYTNPAFPICPCTTLPASLAFLAAGARTSFAPAWSTAFARPWCWKNRLQSSRVPNSLLRAFSGSSAPCPANASRRFPWNRVSASTGSIAAYTNKATCETGLQSFPSLVWVRSARETRHGRRGPDQIPMKTVTCSVCSCNTGMKFTNRTLAHYMTTAQTGSAKFQL